MCARGTKELARLSCGGERGEGQANALSRSCENQRRKEQTAGMHKRKAILVRADVSEAFLVKSSLHPPTSRRMRHDENRTLCMHRKRARRAAQEQRAQSAGGRSASNHEQCG